MTEKEIVRLAEEAELWLHSDRKYEAVKKFANLVAAAEREACAKELEKISNAPDIQAYAAAIRARGQHGN
jgi:hypothetical protein